MKISNVHYAARISSIVASDSNEHAVELYSIERTSDNHSIESKRSFSHERSNSVPSRFQTIVKNFDFLNVEKRGIERVSPNDRTDSTIINTAMIWVRSLYHIDEFLLH